MNEEQILACNAEFVKTYKDTSNPSSKPRLRLAIVTCMDAWISVPDAFKILPGDAHVLRNAGGSAREALRSLIVSQQLLDTDTVYVVKHTRCGMMTKTNAQIRTEVKANTGHSAGHIDFLPFAELEQAVRDDVAWLKGNEFMAKITVLGFVLKLEDGKLYPVRPL